MLNTDHFTETLSADRLALLKELTGMYQSAVADLLACSDVDESYVRLGLVSQVKGMLALRVVTKRLNSEASLGDADVHVDAVVL